MLTIPTHSPRSTAFKRLALRHHPDVGGSAAAYLTLERAYREALAARHSPVYDAGSASSASGWQAGAQREEEEEYDEWRRDWEEEQRREAERARVRDTSEFRAARARMLRLLCWWVLGGAVFKLGALSVVGSLRDEPPGISGYAEQLRERRKY